VELPTDGSVVITRLGTSLRWACTGSTTIADTINAVEGGGKSVTTGRGRIRDIQRTFASANTDYPPHESPIALSNKVRMRTLPSRQRTVRRDSPPFWFGSFRDSWYSDCYRERAAISCRPRIGHSDQECL
jgi:hypothetical protein